MAVGTQNEYLPYIATLKFNMGTAFRNTIFLLLGSILFISQFSISCKEGLRSELPDKIDFNFQYPALNQYIPRIYSLIFVHF